MAEQAFLNWQFSPLGPFPAAPLDRMWGGFFPRNEDKETLKVVHEKLWASSEGWLKSEWEEEWFKMLKFYDSAEFSELRATDNL